MVLSVQLHTVQSLFSSLCQVSRVTLKTDNCILTYHFGAQKQGEGYSAFQVLDKYPQIVKDENVKKLQNKGNLVHMMKDCLTRGPP